MKIRTERGNVIDILGIYWVLSEDSSIAETILLGLPKGSGGLVPYRINGMLAEKVDFFDPTIPEGFIYYHSGIYHHALNRRKLT